MTMPLLSGPTSDPVDQTTARLNALNGTLAAIAESGRDPMQQSKEERRARSALRREVYAEIARLVGPESVVTISPSAQGADTPVGPTAPTAPVQEMSEEEMRGGSHAGL